MGVSVSLLGGFFALDLGIQLVSWAISSYLKTEKFYDLVGSSTFFAMATGSLALMRSFHPRQVLLTGCVALWSARLGTYLFQRVMKEGHDSRFDGVRDNPPVFLIFWTVQALWVFAVTLPLLLVNLAPPAAVAAAPALGALDAAGAALWAFGFAFEVVADRQKQKFREDPDNKGRWIDTGLWSISRHPNYFGEICLWWGLYVASLGGLQTPLAKILGLLSPCFTMYLLTQVSGVPLQDKAAKERWGSDPKYIEYRRNTPVLVPWPFMKKSP